MDLDAALPSTSELVWDSVDMAGDDSITSPSPGDDKPIRSAVSETGAPLSFDELLDRAMREATPNASPGPASLWNRLQNVVGDASESSDEDDALREFEDLEMEVDMMSTAAVMGKHGVIEPVSLMSGGPAD